MILLEDNPNHKLLWTVSFGTYDSEGFVLFVSKTKKRAIELIREDGNFKHNKKDDLFENNETHEWYKLEQIEYLP